MDSSMNQMNLPIEGSLLLLPYHHGDRLSYLLHLVVILIFFLISRSDGGGLSLSGLGRGLVACRSLGWLISARRRSLAKIGRAVRCELHLSTEAKLLEQRPDELPQDKQHRNQRRQNTRKANHRDCCWRRRSSAGQVSADSETADRRALDSGLRDAVAQQ